MLKKDLLYEPKLKKLFLYHELQLHLVDYLYGGLNYQIEHHLFPNMPRNNLGKVRKVVREFCHEHSVRYHETSVIGSNIEIIKCLNQASRPLREKQTSS